MYCLPREARHQWEGEATGKCCSFTISPQWGNSQTHSTRFFRGSAAAQGSSYKHALLLTFLLLLPHFSHSSQMLPAVTLWMSYLPPGPCSKISLQENPRRDAGSSGLEGQTSSMRMSECGRGETDIATQCVELSLEVSSEIAGAQNAVPQSWEGVTREGFLENVLVPYSFRKKLSLLRKKILCCLKVKIQSHLFSLGEELVGCPFAILHSSCYFERF